MKNRTIALRKVNYEIVLTHEKESIIYVIVVSKEGVDLLTLKDFCGALEKLERKLKK